MSLRNDIIKGNIPDYLYPIAEYENKPIEYIVEGLKKGTICIPKNINHTFEHVRAIGEGLSVKINANIGSSPYDMDISQEKEKLIIAQKYGADAIMDLSLGSLHNDIRHMIIKNSSIMIGTVPLYQTAFDLANSKRDFCSFTIKDYLKTLRVQAEEGIDFMTIHSGITLHSLNRLEKQGRILNVISRGGSMLVEWIKKNNQESPLYQYFDEILDILYKYDITLSLGDGMRPGATSDATDHAQIEELIILGELCQRAWDKGVQVMIEGPGHVPYDQIETNIKLQKKLCHNAPFYVLGPLVTDIAPGYDHITAAIGGTLAAVSGADFLCYVTPAEHLKLPSIQDVREGVVASRIAAHAADLARGNKKAWQREKSMGLARRELNWKKQIEISLDPEKAKKYREDSHVPNDENICTMCGEFCSIKKINTLG